MKKKIVIFVILILSGITGIFAQQNKALTELKLGDYSKDWILYKSLDFVDVYYRYSDCSDPSNGFYPEYLLFKVENKTDKKVYVYWEYSQSVDGKAENAGIDENLVQVFLDPKESVEGNCSDVFKTKLGILVRNKMHKSILTDFDLNTIKEFKLN